MINEKMIRDLVIQGDIAGLEVAFQTFKMLDPARQKALNLSGLINQLIHNRSLVNESRQYNWAVVMLLISFDGCSSWGQAYFFYEAALEGEWHYVKLFAQYIRASSVWMCNTDSVYQLASAAGRVDVIQLVTSCFGDDTELKWQVALEGLEKGAENGHLNIVEHITEKYLIYAHSNPLPLTWNDRRNVGRFGVDFLTQAWANDQWSDEWARFFKEKTAIENAFISAATNGHLRVVQHLYSIVLLYFHKLRIQDENKLIDPLGESQNAKTIESLETALLWAAKRNRVKVVLFLIQYKHTQASVDAALRAAYQEGHVRVLVAIHTFFQVKSLQSLPKETTELGIVYELPDKVFGEVFFKLLQACPTNVTDLSLDLHIFDFDVSFLVNALEVLHKNITHIHLTVKTTSQRTVAEFIKIMKALPPCITHVDLTSKALDTKGEDELIAVLEALPDSVISVGLDGNNLPELLVTKLQQIRAKKITGRSPHSDVLAAIRALGVCSNKEISSSKLEGDRAELLVEYSTHETLEK